MNDMKYFTIMTLCVIMLIACNNSSDNEISEKLIGCEFSQNDDDMDGLIDEAEMMIMKECRENSLSSRESIELNLIGEWELIGSGNPWFPTTSKPCGYIGITQDELTLEFNNGNINVMSIQPWNIEEVNLNGNESFKLSLHPEHYLIVNQFCENYIYVDDTPLDGGMFLYKKVY